MPKAQGGAAASDLSIVKVGFPPIADAEARLLILGTLPGEESLRLGQYYAHKQNAFWRLIAAVFGVDMPADYATRKSLLIENHCALWDVLQAAERVGSSDAAIKAPRANVFQEFFQEHNTIEAIAFNGKTARSLFVRYVVKAGVTLPGQARLIDLPSSSPLHTMAYEEKLRLWTSALGEFRQTRKR